MTYREASRPDPSWTGVIRWGGLSLFGAGVVLVLFVLIVLISQQTMPVPAREMLEDPFMPTLLFALAAFGELLLMPGGLALYFSLKHVEKTSMFIATALWLVAVPLFIASRGLIISLSRTSGSYTDATSATTRSAYLVSAKVALETQSVYSMMGLLLLSVASIAIGRVMLKSAVFGRLGYLVIAAGILSLFSPFGVLLSDIPDVISFFGLILSAVWQLLAGIMLYRLGGRVQVPPSVAQPRGGMRVKADLG